METQSGNGNGDGAGEVLACCPLYGTHIGVWPQVGQYELLDFCGGGLFACVTGAGQGAAEGLRHILDERGLGQQQLHTECQVNYIGVCAAVTGVGQGGPADAEPDADVSPRSATATGCSNGTVRR